MRLLNLDTVRQPLGQFTINGQTYTVWPMKVYQIIDLQAAPDDGNVLERLIETIQVCVPDCPADLLRHLDMPQLNALSAWIQSAGPEEAEKNSAPLSPGETAAAPHDAAAPPSAPILTSGV